MELLYFSVRVIKGGSNTMLEKSNSTSPLCIVWTVALGIWQYHDLMNVENKGLVLLSLDCIARASLVVIIFPGICFWLPMPFLLRSKIPSVFPWIQKTVFPIKCIRNLVCLMYQLSEKEESILCLWNVLLKISESTSEASCCPSYRSTILCSHCGCKFSIYMRYSDLSAFNMDQHTLI